MHKYNTKFTRAFLQGACISMLSIVLKHADLRAIIVGFAALGLAYVVGRMDFASEHEHRLAVRPVWHGTDQDRLREARNQLAGAQTRIHALEDECERLRELYVNDQ